ncbi:MAG TPA: PLP-dependent aspartate aminotransferase family protein [Nitrospirota bacterium]|jgi:cystathionine beta-lyase/cystathionine gamma-synthase
MKRFSTKAIHSGQGPDPATGSTVVPIYQTAIFNQEEVGRFGQYQYSRLANPTRDALEVCLADLEEGRHGLGFASGQAASAAVLSVLRPSDHIVLTSDLYGGTYGLAEVVLAGQGITAGWFDAADLETLKAAITPSTRLVWIESPTNPMLRLVDIAGAASICHERGVKLVVDNTFATPYFQRPLTLGADVVVHSMTKYIGGHSDIIAGAVVTSDPEIFGKVKTHQVLAGGICGPFDAWLALRGLKTLAVRMDRHAANAQRVAEFLSGHRMAEGVVYPGLPGHPQHGLAKRQMSGFGGIVTFRIKGGLTAAREFYKALKVFAFAESLGGVESLANHPATMSHGHIPAELRQRVGITESTVRLSVGIEDIEDLIEDLEQALGIAEEVGK